MITSFDRVEAARRNRHNATRADASGGTSYLGIGILHSDIRKEITSEVTYMGMTPSIRFTHYASTAAIR